MKYIKNFKTWLAENYPALDQVDTTASDQIDNDLSIDVADLIFSFFDGGEAKFQNTLNDFNTKYKTTLKVPRDYTSLNVLEDPEKKYSSIDEFVNAYNDCC